jgi:hypothetical protein
MKKAPREYVPYEQSLQRLARLFRANQKSIALKEEIKMILEGMMVPNQKERV